MGNADVYMFFQSLPRDEQKIRTLLVPGSLFLYQLPPPPLIQPMTEEEEESGAGPSAAAPGGTALKSLAASDPHNGSRESLDLPEVQRLSTLDPAGIPAIVSSTAAPPTGPRSPSHSRSPSNVSITTAEASRASDLFENFVIGVHRKMNLLDLYFLSSQKSRPSLFGTPIIIPRKDTTTNAEIYQFVWTQIARLVSPLPPSELKMANHALDCDDSLGYEYPFILKEVQKDGFSCDKCPWYRFCRGCKVECNGELYGRSSSFLAIDWEATALHLRYQTTQEKYHEEHESVAISRQKQTEPIDLDTCLQAFTQWEELDEDQLYYCSKCKAHCLASKKLDIWRLPPILIINLKRFQYLNGRWVKSHKIVNFPLQAFDPSAYLAERDPRSPTDISLTPTDSVFSDPLPSDLSGHHHPRLQQVEQYHQQDEQSSGNVSVSSSSVSTSSSQDSSLNLHPTATVSVATATTTPLPANTVVSLQPRSSTSAKPSETEQLSASALMMKQSTDRLSNLSTSSAGSGSMLGHVTTIVLDGTSKSGQDQQPGSAYNSQPPSDSVSRPSLNIPAASGTSTTSSSSSGGVAGASSTVSKLPQNMAANINSSVLHYNSPRSMVPQQNTTSAAKDTSESPLAAALVKPTVNGIVKARSDSQAISDRLHGFDTEDYTHVKYNLYAMSCHTGILGGGHYVAYAKNDEHKRWFVYNDSSCKEISENQLDKNSAYILFYERENVDFNRFMPDTTGQEPDLAEIDDEFESDFKKMCVLQ
ncbi:ubiquitin carboxyl-terminal hydrolase 32 [Elysia marginata]|uniref:ubiquitinyl hydrolase 1 n=1 Tax=Elysia marginata TaxID=1093978 RepID=A0AAV4FD05_9GAST|nr:ubiquitin carboxyl-terminal hydrolase 32 [Elysia marginata]